MKKVKYRYNYKCKCSSRYEHEDVWPEPIQEKRDCPRCGYSNMPEPVQFKYKLCTNTRERDGFKTGWNPSLQCHIGSRQEYSRVLKARGLEELGNEKIPDYDPEIEYYTDDMIRKLHDCGVDLGSVAIKALREGKVNVDLSQEDQDELKDY